MFIYEKTSSNAIAVMRFLAEDPRRRAGSAEIAKACKISRALTAKLLTQLATAGLVKDQPGPGGGSTLAKSSGKICLLDIASLFEQTEPPSLCPFGHDGAARATPGPLHNMISGDDRLQPRLHEENQPGGLRRGDSPDAGQTPEGRQKTGQAGLLEKN